MTITVGGSTPSGTYPITVTGNGGGIQQNTTVTLTVTAPAELHDFGLTGFAQHRAGQSGNVDDYHHHQRRLQQLHQSVGFRHAHRAVTVSFNPQTIPAPGSGSSTMTITVCSGTLRAPIPSP